MTRLLICACGEEFTPNGREVRCRICRFAPSSKPRNKLTKADIPVIRARAEAGETAGRIAKSYGVARGTILAAKDRKTWRLVGCEWRPVPGYEGRYEISEFGDVVSLIKGRRVLRPTFDKGGYRIKLSNRVGKKSAHYISRLMLLAFCPLETPKLYLAIPVNDNLRDLRLSNWKWILKAGEHAGNHKLTAAQAQAIKARLLADSALSYGILSKEYQVSISSISHIMSGENWNHVS